MKNKLITFAAITAILFASIFTSCYIPSPLYGTWADGNGKDKIEFQDDGTFTASISNTDGTSTEYSGEWTTVDNILVLNIKGSSNYSRNVPWSLNGAILYLDWTGSNDSHQTVTLYHTAR